MKTMTYRGYAARIEYSAADDCQIGRVAAINDIISFHGDSLNEIRDAFEASVDFYLKTCAESGREPNKPYSGRIFLRLPPELHARLAVEAKNQGQSLNSFLVEKLSVFAR
ncbi:MAG: type II toxin-antitoxin system HicB family antitoxin [Deltaproteobacteria bacterium]|nr:type II toxin-antitoxin system HicB family antitoxin [Deltaproteobacteria bacterium]